jgi:Domain of unknown function (DUF5671)
MARSLYRVFLYVVVNVMLGFAAFSLGSLLTTIFGLTPLRGGNTPPSGSALVQTTVLAAVALVFFLALGGLFYWLIRRDMAQDPAAARGAVRAIFLNLAQAVAAIIAIFAGLTFCEGIGQPGPYLPDLSGSLAATLVAVAVFVLEQAERRRAAPADGAPLVLQRVHLYGVQVVVLVTAASVWHSAIDASERVVLANFGLINGPCDLSPLNQPPAPFVCPYASTMTGLWLAVLWTVAAWLVYFMLVRRDAHSVLRVLGQYAGFLTGLISVLIGVEQAVELGLRGAFGVEANIASALVSSYQFFPTLIFGAVAMAVYGAWQQRESSASPLGEQGTELTTLTLTTITVGVPFYVAIVQLLHILGERAFAGTALAPADLAASLALLFIGLAHPFTALELRRRTVGGAPIGPRRGFVLAGLAAGALAGAIGGAIALYLLITALLGSPVGTDWPTNARMGAVVFLVGAFITGVHLWRAVVERSFAAHPGAAGAADAAPPQSIEAILDELLAGKITRDQAVARLRSLAH